MLQAVQYEGLFPIVQNPGKQVKSQLVHNLLISVYYVDMEQKGTLKKYFVNKKINFK